MSNHLQDFMYDLRKVCRYHWRKFLCRHRGHVPGQITRLIDRGPTCEGIDGLGCKRCGVWL